MNHLGRENHGNAFRQPFKYFGVEAALKAQSNRLTRSATRLNDEYAGGAPRRIHDCAAGNNHRICAAGDRDFDGYRHVLAQEFQRIWHTELDLDCTRLRIDTRIDVDQLRGKLRVWKCVGGCDRGLSQSEEPQVLFVDLYNELHRATG